jgi:hypothetical protein
MTFETEVDVMTQTKTSVSHKILLADDNESVRDMMNAMLEMKGFK